PRLLPEEEGSQQGHTAQQHGGHQHQTRRLDRPALQQHRIQPPGQHRHYHDQVASVELQLQQTPKLASGQHQQQAGQAQQGTADGRTVRPLAQQQDGPEECRHRKPGAYHSKIDRRGTLRSLVQQGVVGRDAQRGQYRQLFPAGQQRLPVLPQSPGRERQQEDQSQTPAPEGQADWRQNANRSPSNQCVASPGQCGQHQPEHGPL